MPWLLRSWPISAIASARASASRRGGPTSDQDPGQRERNAAVQHLVTTFFGGSAEQAMAALLDISDLKTSGDTLDRLSKKIQSARKEGR